MVCSVEARGLLVVRDSYNVTVKGLLVIKARSRAKPFENVRWRRASLPHFQASWEIWTATLGVDIIGIVISHAQSGHREDLYKA